MVVIVVILLIFFWKYFLILLGLGFVHAISLNDIRRQVNLRENRKAWKLLLNALFLAAKDIGLVYVLDRYMTPGMYISMIAVPLTVDPTYRPGYVDTWFRVSLNDIFLRDVALFISCFIALTRCAEWQTKHYLFQTFFDRSWATYRSVCSMILWLTLLIGNGSPIPLSYKTRFVLFIVFLSIRLIDWCWRAYLIFGLIPMACRPTARRAPETDADRSHRAAIWTAPTAEQLEKAENCSICETPLRRTPGDAERNEPGSSANENGLPVSLTCNHMFHEKCIATWVVRHNTCPLCRADVIQAETLRNSRTNSTVATDQFLENNPPLSLTPEWY